MERPEGEHVACRGLDGPDQGEEGRDKVEACPFEMDDLGLDKRPAVLEHARDFAQGRDKGMGVVVDSVGMEGHWYWWMQMAMEEKDWIRNWAERRCHPLLYCLLVHWAEL